MPLVGITADEPVEILEAESGGPEVERPGLARLPVWHVVVLAIPGRVPPILLERFRDRAAALRHDRVVAGVARPEFRDDPGGASVMIASGDQRRARGRAESSRVEHVVAQAGLPKLVVVRRGN